MRKIYALFIGAMFGIASVQAQDATLAGRITEVESGEPLIQANVIIDVERGLATATDFDGNYVLKLPAGEYTVYYRYVGFGEKSIQISLAAGETLTRDISLSESVELLDVVVVSASKFEKKLSEETVSMEVVQADLLNSNNITQMEEGMKRVPGVTVTEGQANIRGGSGWSYGAGSRVLILVDDLPMLTADANDAKWSAIPVENTQQVEVIKGAASALYGSSALNGIINIRTAYPTDKPFTKIMASFGVYDGQKGNDFDFDQTDPDYTTKLQDFQRDSANSPFLNADWYRDENFFPFTSNINMVHRRKVKRVDLVFSGAYVGDRSFLRNGGNEIIRTNIKIRYRTKKDGLNIGVNTMFYRGWGRVFFIWDGLRSQTYQPLAGTVSTYRNIRATVDPFITFVDQKNNSFSWKGRFFNASNVNDTDQGSIPNTYYSEFQYRRRIEPWKLNVVTGLVGNYFTVRSPGDSPEASLVGEHTGFNLGAYAQFDKRLIDRISLAFGMRYEYTQYDNTFKSDLNRPTFRGGINYQAAEATFIRASVGDGYRFPSMAELFVQTNISALEIVPNPGLTSESGLSAEIGVKQGYKVGGFKGYVDGSFFLNQYKNMMEFTFASTGLSINDLENSEIFFSSQNVGDTRILGMELTTAGKGKIGSLPFTVLAGYTYISPKSLNWDAPLVLNDKDGNPIVQDPSLAIFSTNTNNIPQSGEPFTYGTYSSSNYNVLKYRFRHTIKADMEVSWKQFDFGYNMQANSFMENIDFLFVSPILEAAQNTPGFLGDGSSRAFSSIRDHRTQRFDKWDVFLDLRASYRPNEKSEITFLVKNALNQSAVIRPAFPATPRSYNFQFSYTF